MILLMLAVTWGYQILHKFRWKRGIKHARLFLQLTHLAMTDNWLIPTHWWVLPPLRKTFLLITIKRDYPSTTATCQPTQSHRPESQPLLSPRHISVSVTQAQPLSLLHPPLSLAGQPYWALKHRLLSASFAEIINPAPPSAHASTEGKGINPISKETAT